MQHDANSRRAATRLFIFERLDEGSANRRFGRTDGGYERCYKNDGQQQERDLVGELVRKLETCDFMGRYSEAVIELDGAEGESQNHSDGADRQRFKPDRTPDLVAHSTHGLQHTKLAAAIGNRYRERIDDAQNRHQDRDRYLYVRQAEPLVREPLDDAAQVPVRKDKETAFIRETLQDRVLHLHF